MHGIKADNIKGNRGKENDRDLGLIEVEIEIPLALQKASTPIPATMDQTRVVGELEETAQAGNLTEGTQWTHEL